MIKCGVLLAVMLGQIGLADASEIDVISGEWRTVRHGADVRIEDCGNGTPCGFLVSVGSDIRGGATQDLRNKRAELRTRPLKNLPILWGYQKHTSGWKSGRLYNPETGQTFRSSLMVISENEIKVKGCLGPFCREQIWTRILDDNTNNCEKTCDPT